MLPWAEAEAEEGIRKSTDVDAVSNSDTVQNLEYYPVFKGLKRQTRMKPKVLDTPEM